MLSFDQSLPMILHRALDRVMPEFRDLFARYNLTEQQWRVLRVLWAAKKVSTAELSARTLLPPPSLVGIIDRLEKKKLVARLRSVEDRRVVFVLATAEGRALEKDVAPHVAQINKSLRSRVTAEEWRMMEDVLARISGDDAAGERDVRPQQSTRNSQQ